MWQLRSFRVAIFGTESFSHGSGWLCGWPFFLLLPELLTGAATLPGQDNDKTKAKLPTVRWSEQQPGCTFERGDDGKYRYGLWSGDVGCNSCSGRARGTDHSPPHSGRFLECW